MTANTRLFGLFINNCAVFIFNYVLINAVSRLTTTDPEQLITQVIGTCLVLAVTLFP
jgi:K+-sensing histidine kinase KdpD